MMHRYSKAFTLIEVLISVSILSIIMVFLYRSYASFNISNELMKVEQDNTQKVQKIKKIVYLDFLLAMHKSINIVNREPNEDFIFLQSSSSTHKRYNPYIVYKVKEEKLYRLESLQPMNSYDLPVDAEYDVDYLGEVRNFRVYKESNTDDESYLIDLDFKEMEDLLLKVKVLNEY